MKKVELNFVDKAVAFFNPQAAVDRLASRAKLTKFEYDATMYNRQRRVPSSLSGAEGFRSTYDRVEMMKRARDLDQNFGIVRSLLLKFATHVAANISYQARTDSQNVNSDVEAYWNSWWDKCDLSGRHTGSILMQIATISFLRDGDFFFILVRDQDGNLKLQGIEADRIGDPFRTYTSLNHIGGIHINQETGAPDGYDVYLRTFGNAYLFQATIPASQVFHLYDPLRIDQYRGVTALCTAINDATDLYEITQMEKMAQKIASSQGGIVKRNNNNASDLASLANDLDTNNNVIKIESIEPGRITYLEPGEEIQFPDSPNRPGNGFQEFHKILLRNICMGVGLPYSFAVDPSAMSGPTARLEMQQASRTFKRHQKLLEDKILRPVKNIVIADGVARGLIKNNLGSKSTKGIFNFGASVSIDLGRESQANIAEWRAGLTTAGSIYGERGLDVESALRARALEAKMIEDLAKQYGVQPNAISDTILGSINQPQQDQQTDGETKPAEQTYVADQALNGAQVASLIQVINAVASGAISKEGSVSIITSAFPFISPEEAARIVQGINIGTIAPTTKTPEPTGIPQQAPAKLANENDVPIIKPQDTESGESGGDGDVDVGEEREPSEKGAVESLPTGTTKEGKIAPKVPNILESLDRESVELLVKGMMDACELGKYSDIDFTPPQGARDAAKRALDVREKKPASERGMTPVGIARARDLIAGKALSPDTIRRMHSFFSRHEVDKKGESWDKQGKGWQAWNGWGGDAGYAWVRKVIKQMESREKNLEEPAACPIATQDIKTNLANRKTAVDDANYGPANPNEPNGEYWRAKANEFQGDVATAKTMRCGNCAAFNQTKKMMDCISKGIGADANEVEMAGNLGYCEIFDFKCAAKRTCDAWIAGGPITDDKKKVETEFVAGRDCGQDEGGTFGPGNDCAVGYGRPAIKGGYLPKRPNGQFPKNYKRPTKKEEPKKPLPPKPLPPKPLPPKPLPPTPTPGGTKSTEEKKSKFPNSKKDYDSKEKASLDSAIKSNQKELESVRQAVIKNSEDTLKEIDSAKSSIAESEAKSKEIRVKTKSLREEAEKHLAENNTKKYIETKRILDEEYTKLGSLERNIEEQQKKIKIANEKARQIGFSEIRKDMLAINKQDGFSSEQLNKATEELKKKQETAIANDKQSLKDGSLSYVKERRLAAQEALREICNPNIHSESLTRPVEYWNRNRADSTATIVEFSDGTRSSTGGGIRVKIDTDIKTYMHEYGHQIEDGNPEVKDLCREFLDKRTSGEKIEKFQKTMPGYGYKRYEKGSADNFGKAHAEIFPESNTNNRAYYTGKRYDDTPFGKSSKYIGATEVYSMGMELLHRNPAKFAKVDPEWFDLVTGIATGRLLKKTRGVEQ